MANLIDSALLVTAEERNLYRLLLVAERESRVLMGNGDYLQQLLLCAQVVKMARILR